MRIPATAIGLLTFALLIFGLLIFAAPALAQFEPLQFAICKKVAIDADRLKCFDTIGAKGIESQPSEPPLVKGKWVYTESTSPVDDSPQIVAMLEGETSETVLVFRCWENRTEAIFIPGTFFFATGRVNVLMRINSDPPETLSWTVGTNSKALFVSSASDFMKLLPDDGKLFLRATGFQGRQAYGTFNLADISSARSKIADTCHWSTLKADRAKANASVPVVTPTPARPTAKSQKPL